MRRWGLSGDLGHSSAWAALGGSQRAGGLSRAAPGAGARGNGCLENRGRTWLPEAGARLSLSVQAGVRTRGNVLFLSFCLSQHLQESRCCLLGQDARPREIYWRSHGQRGGMYRSLSPQHRQVDPGHSTDVSDLLWQMMEVEAGWRGWDAHSNTHGSPKSRGGF